MTTLFSKNACKTAPKASFVVVLLAVVFLFAVAANAQQYQASPSAGQFYGQQPADGGRQPYMRHQGAQQPSRSQGEWVADPDQYWTRSPHQGRPGFSQQQQGQEQAWQLEGLVRIGYDLDNDGYLETFEYIPYYELQRIRQQQQGRSQQQAQMDRRYEGQGFQRYHDQGRMRQPQAGQMHPGMMGMRQDPGTRGYFEQGQQQIQQFDSVQGRIQQMRAVNLAEMDEPHVIARVETENGQVARVDLGPQRKIADLNLQQGDQVQIIGSLGTLNNKPYLIAHNVRAGQQQVRINRPQDKNIRNYTGQILNTKPAGFGDQGANNLMARVRLQDGSTTIVNLGPEKELKGSLNVQRGKQIDMLARPAFIEGKRALVAEAVTIDGRTFDVSWEKQPSQPSGVTGQSRQESNAPSPK